MTTPALSIHQPEAADARSLSDQAYYRIRELIVTLELPPGSLVSERELMEQLGLGRTPVREALRALARDCLVDVYPRRGMFVSGVDVRDLAGLSEVRMTLESRAARLAAERATVADRARSSSCSRSSSRFVTRRASALSSISISASTDTSTSARTTSFSQRR